MQRRQLRLSRKAEHALQHPLAGSNTLQPESGSTGVDWIPELSLLLGEGPQIEGMERPGQSEKQAQGQGFLAFCSQSVKVHRLLTFHLVLAAVL